MSSSTGRRRPMTDRARQLHRVMRQAIYDGVTRETVAEVCRRLAEDGPVDPTDLQVALGQYVPDRHFHRDRPSYREAHRALMELGPGNTSTRLGAGPTRQGTGIPS